MTFTTTNVFVSRKCSDESSILQNSCMFLQPDSVMKNDSLRCPVFVDNTYTPIYSCDMAKETALLGLVSLTLTLLNIICIFCMGICVLKVGLALSAQWFLCFRQSL